MATLRSTCNLSARLIRQTIRASDAPVRGFSASARCLAAQNFTMPALSPTMTEGNIATWRVREGDTFSAGDVLLEIETDKATMDVEAQEDGIVMKIMQGDGAKSVQVGTRIAVIAESGDDIKSLELPPDENAGKAQPAKAEEPQQSSQPSGEKKKEKTVGKNTSGETHEQKYPLLPSVEHLVKQHGIDEAAVKTITPTGPGGRLLKGDVLAYLGEIDVKKPAEVSAFIQKLAHLDLSNIKLAPKKEPSKEDKEKKSKAAPVVEAPSRIPLAQQISLEKLVELQARVKRKLGAEVSLETLVQRAINAANEGLPPPPPTKPTPNEVFDDILGILPKKKATTSRGSYSPVWKPAASLVIPGSRPLSRARQVDIIDELAGLGPVRQVPAPVAVGLGVNPNISHFSLLVAGNERPRAEVFMNKLAHILTQEPDQLLFK